jgi:hypothetical protein
MLVLSEDDYLRELNKGDLHYMDLESADYPEGYVEGKYISESFMKAVAKKGSEPARFAFKDAVILYSGLNNLESVISAASAYPKERKTENIIKFYAQFEGWKWMFGEGLKKNDAYVINFSVTNICLFAGRLLLAHNELLYPYHKWFLRVLAGAEKKPEGIIETINAALSEKNKENVEKLFNSVKDFYDWPKYEYGWAARFVLDSEINWIDGPVPVADL